MSNSGKKFYRFFNLVFLAKNTVPPSLNSSCICQFDRFTYSAWPCRAQKNWIESICPGKNLTIAIHVFQLEFTPKLNFVNAFF